jgi:N-methylhydantoinase B
MEIHPGLATEVIESGWKDVPADGRPEPTVIRNKTARAEVAIGDVARNITAGGGGYGDPLLRDPAAVAFDVAEGAVSTQAAEQLYGVLLSADGEADQQATADLRAQRRRDRLGGEDPKKQVTLEEGQSPGVVPGEGDQVACGYCGEPLGGVGAWQDSVLTTEREMLPALEAGNVPISALEGVTMQLVERFCPGCASCLETIVSDGVSPLPRFYIAPEDVQTGLDKQEGR